MPLNHTVTEEQVTVMQNRKVISGATLEVSIGDILVLHALVGRSTGTLTDALWRQVDDIFEALPAAARALKPDLSPRANPEEKLPAIAFTRNGQRIDSAELLKRVQTALSAASIRV